MPRPLSPCSVPGCPNVAVKDGRCELHQRERTRAPDTRPPASARGYDAKWRRVRAQYLKRHRWCELCGAEATEAHHILPLAQGGTHEWPNLQALCKSCHSRVTDQQGGGWPRRAGEGA